MGRIAHADDFRRVADAFAERDLLKLLGVSPRTLKRWRSGRARIPWAAYQLAYDHSQYGLAERDAAEHFNRQMLQGAHEALQQHVTRLEHSLVEQSRLIAWGAANDPFIWPPDPRSRAV